MTLPPDLTETGRFRIIAALLRPVGRSGCEDGRRRYPHDEKWDESEREAKRRDELRQFIYRMLERLVTHAIYLTTLYLTGSVPPG